MTSSRVSKSMSRLGVLLLCLVATGAACGGKNKAKTTPDTKPAKGSADQSMKDGNDPVDPGGGTAPGGGTNPGGGPVGQTPGGNGGGTLPPEPTVVPPNLDPDPAQAKTQVDQYLAQAKSSLSGPAPDAEGALKHARAALAVDAASVDAAAMVAFAYYHKKLYDTAELVLDDLFKREAAKKNANVFYVYGLVYDQTNRPEAAVKSYRSAVDLNPNHASALVNLGVHLLKNSQYTEAEQAFERLTTHFQRVDAVTLTSLGSAYRGRSAEYPPGAPDRDRYVQKAEKEYKRAEQANPSYGPVYYNLGLLYLDTDPYPGIADPLQRLTVSKAYFDKYKNMAGVDMKLFDSRMKDVDKATKRAQKAAKKKKP